MAGSKPVLPFRARNPRGRLALLSAATLASAAIAAPGDPYPDFGVDGRMIVDFGPGESHAQAVAHLPDGRIVLAGVSTGIVADDACAVAVLLPDGSPDPAFGNGGRVLLDFDPGRANGCEDVLVQPDGRIVLAGYRDTNFPPGTHDFMVIRLLADGSLDGSFSENGYAFVNFALTGTAVRSIDEAHALTLQPDGKLVVAGRAERGPGDYDVAVARFNPDGSPDDGFGDNGRATLGIDGAVPSIDEAWAVAIQDDGRIVLAGHSQENLIDHMLVARLTAAGSPDPAFNLVGHRLVDFGLVPHALAHGLAIREDGVLLLGGYVSDGETADFAVAAVSGDGIIETGFGVNGRVTVDFGNSGSADGALAMAVDAAGRLLLGGLRDASANGIADSDMAALRLLPDGSPDPAFGVDGEVVIAFDLADPSFAADAARDIHVLPDGGIVLAGSAVVAGASTGTEFALVKLQGEGDTLFADGFEGPSVAAQGARATVTGMAMLE